MLCEGFVNPKKGVISDNAFFVMEITIALKYFCIGKGSY